MGNTYWKIWIVHPSSLQTLHDGSIPDNVMDSTSINLRGHLRMGIYTWGFGSCILGLWWHLTNGRLDTSLLMDAYRPFGDQMPLRNILRMHWLTFFFIRMQTNAYVIKTFLCVFLHFLPSKKQNIDPMNAKIWYGIYHTRMIKPFVNAANARRVCYCFFLSATISATAFPPSEDSGKRPPKPYSQEKNPPSPSRNREHHLDSPSPSPWLEVSSKVSWSRLLFFTEENASLIADTGKVNIPPPLSLPLAHFPFFVFRK